MRGYMGQYDQAGAAIYAELERGQLLWIGVADRSAGIADDLVLGFDGLVIGHQFKTSRFPAPFRIVTLLTGAEGLLKPLIDAWQGLRKHYPGSRVQIRFVVSDYPSDSDTPGDALPPHSAAFLADFELNPHRSLDEWRQAGWGRLVDALHQASGLDESPFEQFLQDLKILHGAAADFVQLHKLSSEQARLAAEIAKLLPDLVRDVRDKDKWSRDELLGELGWRDPAKTRHIHRFPVGAHVQRNRDTEVALLDTMKAVSQGYVALVGPPGSGKSTLLQMTLATEPDIRLVRYLAFVPGTAQGVGRGEADDFLEDVGTQLRTGGLVGVRLRDTSQTERREQFGALLKQAGERFERDGVRTIIVVDGLDHIPREERPARSLLSELPLPNVVPAGVIFVLGSQRLDLVGLPPAVAEQAGAPGRLVTMRPLSRDAVAKMADVLGLDAAIPRPRIAELSLGHPLATRYLIQALLRADAVQREALLAGSMPFDGEIDAVYAAAWREVANDPDAARVLGFIARAEAPLSLSLLSTIVDERAIERALVVSRHLLVQSPQGWSVFHNSFRLFIIAKPRISLGSVDVGYQERVYRELAGLARTAPPESPQRWLELRYLARAGDGAAVLALATPQRFRRELAQGRGIDAIHSDIRLALLAARSTYDATALTRLLLCRDEVSRRTTALEYAHQLPAAMLAHGDVEAADAFVRDFPDCGYDVVDAWLERGDFDRAKELFEFLDPLAQLHTSRFQDYGEEHNIREFEKWARRAFHFRDFEQIRSAIDHLATEGLDRNQRQSDPDRTEQVRAHLHREVAEAVISARAASDPADVCKQLGIGQQLSADLMLHAGLAARDRGDHAKALQLFESAMKLPEFPKTPSGWRRSIALLALEHGRQDVAEAIFGGLTAPMISMGDDETDVSGPGDLASAVMEHTQLCTLLGKPLPPVTVSKHAILQPLQGYATKVGLLLARSSMAGGPRLTGAVQEAARAAMGYVLRINPRGGSDFYLTQQAMAAAPVLARALLKIAASVGEEEYRAVLKEIDDAVSTSTSTGTRFLQREVSLAAYRNDGNRDAASDRLERLAAGVQESTPSEQIDGLADLAIAFASIGAIQRARELLATVPDHCLGNALAARKDPLYTTWRDIFVLANEADPLQRPHRIAQLMRQVQGMKETEGASSAHRLTMSLIDEAMRVDARTGYDVSQTLADWGLIAWPNRVDLLMTGMLARRPEMWRSCTVVWCGLALPFYMEPHYRDPYHVGDFIDAAFDAAGPTHVADLADMLLFAIEVDGRAHERLDLLQRLQAAAKRHGHSTSAIDNAVRRWSSEAPEPRHSYTPQRYDGSKTLSDLRVAMEADGDKVQHDASSRFAKLVTDAPLDQVIQMYERWPVLQSDTRCRFKVIDRLLDAGDIEQARRLLREYDASDERWRAWNRWSGAGKFHYYEALKRIEGASMQRAAFESLVDSINGGEENSQALLAEIDSLLPVIAPSPDWPAIWELLAEQMAATREYQLGTPFKPSSGSMDDEALLAELVVFAMLLPVDEVRRHARNCILDLAQGDTQGQTTFTLVLNHLLAGRLDEPLQALLILLGLSSDQLDERFSEALSGLAHHTDVAVAEAAVMLASRWGVALPRKMEPLPLFYQLEIEGAQEESDPLLDDDTGAMRLENALGWTRNLVPVAASLAEASGVDEVVIRRRAALFIQDWGGMDGFGPPALKRLTSQLRSIEMQITYSKPHAMAGVLALRYVAGELRLSGMLDRRKMPTLLESLNAALPPRLPAKPQVRPEGLHRPLPIRNASWDKGEQEWADKVEEDVFPWSDPSGMRIVSEISTFKVVLARRAELHQFRIRAPGIDIDGEDFWDCYNALPASVWLGRLVPFDNDLAPTLVRRVLISLGPGFDSPRLSIAICPNWLRRLRWAEHPETKGLFVDAAGAVVAKLVWWRDGSPADIDVDFMWGEGAFLALSPQGMAQFIAIRGQVSINSMAMREAEKPREEKIRIVRMAKQSYSI